MSAYDSAPRRLWRPPAAAVALVLVAPLIPLLGLIAATAPTVALALTAGVVVMTALLSNLTLGVCIFVVVQFALPIFPVDALTKVMGVALVARWLIEIAYPNPARRLKSLARQYPLIAAFVIASLVYSITTALWAPAPGQVFSHVQRYALDTVLLATVFAAARSREALRWIGTAIASGGALTVILLLIAGTNIDSGRLTDSSVDANELAMTLVASILFGCLLAIQSNSNLSRLCFVGISAIDFYGLLLTNSRGGMLALLGALFAWVVVGGRWRGRLAFGAVIALVLGTAYIAAVAPAAQRLRVEEVIGVGTEHVDRSGTGRTSIWAVGVRAFDAHPLRGSGYGNYQTVSPHYLLTEPGLVESKFILHPLVAHNTYLQSLVEVGILGSLLFFAPVAGALIAFLVAARRFRLAGNEELELYARTGFAALVGVLVASFFLSEGLAKILWILMGISFGLCDLNNRRQARSRYII